MPPQISSNSPLMLAELRWAARRRELASEIQMQATVPPVLPGKVSRPLRIFHKSHGAG